MARLLILFHWTKASKLQLNMQLTELVRLDGSVVEPTLVADSDVVMSTDQGSTTLAQDEADKSPWFCQIQNLRVSQGESPPQ